MKKTNEIAIARKAVRKALKNGEILRDTSAMSRVAYDSIVGLCKNAEIARELSWHAVKDVYFGA